MAYQDLSLDLLYGSQHFSTIDSQIGEVSQMITFNHRRGVQQWLRTDHVCQMITLDPDEAQILLL